MVAKQEFIRVRASELNVRWSTHAVGELTPEGLSVFEVELALQQAQVIEDYPHSHRYLPDCLVLILDRDNGPVHAVVAINQAHNYILVVTVYRPNEKEWQDDWRTRR